MKIIGLDLSLTSTGWASYDSVSGEFKAGRIVSKGKQDDTLEQRVIRLDKICKSIRNLTVDVDRAIVEAPTPGSQGHQHDRSGLWWLAVDALVDNLAHVTEVSPTTLKKYVTGSGVANKDDMLTDCIRTYPQVPFRGNDEADGTGLLAMGVRHYLPGHELEEKRTLVQLSAMDAVRWAS